MAASHPSTAVRRFHPHLRDLWTVNVRRATSWVAVGSVGLTAALVGLAAKETPAHHTSGSTSTGGTPVAGSAATTPSSGSDDGAAGTPSAGAAPTSSATGSATAPTAGSSAPATTSGSVVGPSTGSPQVSTGLS